MVGIEASSFIIIVADQFINDDHDEESSNNTDDLMTMMQFVPFTSISNLPLYTIQQRHTAQVRSKLNEQKYNLISPYQTPTNILYAYKETEMNEKVIEYMQQTNAFVIVHQFNENCQNYIQIYFDFIWKQIKNQLDILYTQQYINSTQYSLLHINQFNAHFDQLHFIPDLRKCNIPFEPMIISCCGPTTNISQYIYQLIAPIYYDQVARQITFSQGGSDAVHAIDLYNQKGLLRRRTLFATLQIHNLCTTFPHSQTIKSFECFLNDYLPNGEIQGLSIKTIIKLVHCILSHQYSVNGNKLYRQIKGGPVHLPLTNLLADIYMFYWQKKLVHILHNQKEIYGRCLGQIFFTWNKSKDEFINLIRNIDYHHQRATNVSVSSLHLTATIESSINYMDVKISNMNGALQTEVFHQSLLEPYCLPYITNHPPYEYLTLVRAALLRAVRCCSNMHDFTKELNFIRLSFLLNYFSAEYIEQCIDLFYQEFQFKTKSFRYVQHPYDILRRRIQDYDQSQPTTFMVTNPGYKSSDENEDNEVENEVNNEVENEVNNEVENEVNNEVDNEVENEEEEDKDLTHTKSKKDLKRRWQYQWECSPSYKRIKRAHY